MQIRSRSNSFFSYIVPVHNEETGITDFLTALDEYAQSVTPHYEIIIIDDGSTDKTASVLEATFSKPPFKHIYLSRNFGKEKAMTAGLDSCTGDAAILIDADFQHPFEVVNTFVEHWEQGYDMPYGVRKDRLEETWLKRFFARLFYRLMKDLSEVDIPSHAGDFRLLDRSVINALKTCPEKSRFMKGLFAWVGFKSIAVPYQVQKRLTGKSSWSFWRLFDLALTGMISFSDMPLRIWSLLGILISTISLIYAAWIVFKTLLFGVDVPGYATIVTAIMFFGGVQLISVGILGEYIARIFREVKQRPQYLVSKKIGFE